MKSAAIVLGVVIVVLLGVLAFVNPARTPSAPLQTTSTASTTSTVPVGTVPATSGVRGTVTLGPTCPVEKNPPDPACAPKGFATSIAVFKGSTASGNIYKTVGTDASGTFTIALDPGTYTFQPKGGSPLPRCSAQTVTVSPRMFNELSLQCDTGIR
jgi:hypothetical protein